MPISIATKRRSATPVDLSRTKLTYLRPEEIDFDPANPRFGRGKRQNVSQDTLFRELLQDPHNATALVDSFVENGFIPYEPLIVKPKESGGNVVIEGNRRLAAVKYIRQHPEKYEASVISALDNIPSLVFPSDAPETDIRTYLGIRHLLGFREWPALSKAMFLDAEAKRTGDLNKLLREISLTKTDARRFLVPYRLFGEINQKLPEGEDFWVFAEAISRAGIKKFIELDVDATSLKIISFDRKKLERLLDMLYGPVLPSTDKRDVTKKFIEETRDLTKLGKVLASPDACAQLLRRKDLDEAYLYIDSRAELIQKFEKQISQMKVLVDRLKPPGNMPEYRDLLDAANKLETAFKKFRSKKHG